MSFSVVMQCPLHPKYAAKIAPDTKCRACAALWAGRNAIHKILSTPIEERGSVEEVIIKEVSP